MIFGRRLRIGMKSSPYQIYLGMPLQRNSLDIYLARTSIEKALRSALPAFHGTFLDVGCGIQPYRELISNGSRVERYIGMDLQQAVEPVYGRIPPDLGWDGITIPLDDFGLNRFDVKLGSNRLSGEVLAN